MHQISEKALTFLLVWLFLTLASFVCSIKNFRSSSRAAANSNNALVYTTLAIIPGTALLLEFGVQIFLVSLNFQPNFSPSDFITLFPVALGQMLGFALMLFSYVSFPLKRGSWSIQSLRFLHVATWMTSTWAVLLSVASV